MLNQYSDDHGFDTRVLGARKGGQLLDIISCAKFSLELGRDSNDQAAVALLDVSNFHDRFDRMLLFQSLRRRHVCVPWALAAVRIQRCAKVHLRVRGIKTACIVRQTGSQTGNTLCPLLGRIMMEDMFSVVDPQIETSIFNLFESRLWPMAWSDNVVVFSKSVAKAAQIPSIIADTLYDLGGHAVKEGSEEIVLACSRRLP